LNVAARTGGLNGKSAEGAGKVVTVGSSRFRPTAARRWSSRDLRLESRGSWFGLLGAPALRPARKVEESARSTPGRQSEEGAKRPARPPDLRRLAARIGRGPLFPG